ncbi:MAG TPA: hypothetical protein DD670_04920 [Planctomycetaceae bacterium]|nr:hypothetical protein [Planctomycetaceae bacterium]
MARLADGPREDFEIAPAWIVAGQIVGRFVNPADEVVDPMPRMEETVSRFPRIVRLARSVVRFVLLVRRARGWGAWFV